MSPTSDARISAPGSPLAGTRISTQSPADGVPNDIAALNSSHFGVFFLRDAGTDAPDLTRHGGTSAGAATSSQRAAPVTRDTVTPFSALGDESDISISSGSVEERDSAWISSTDATRGFLSVADQRPVLVSSSDACLRRPAAKIRPLMLAGGKSEPLLVPNPTRGGSRHPIFLF